MYAATRESGFGARGEAPDHDRHLRAVSAGYYDAYYTQAQKVRTLISQDFDKAWEQL